MERKVWKSLPFYKNSLKDIWEWILVSKFWLFSIAELMMMGFLSLLLTVCEKPIANICIPRSAGRTLLPCGDRNNNHHSGEEAKCKLQVCIHTIPPFPPTTTRLLFRFVRSHWNDYCLSSISISKWLATRGVTHVSTCIFMCSQDWGLECDFATQLARALIPYAKVGVYFKTN